MSYFWRTGVVCVAISFFLITPAYAAPALTQRVDEAFKTVYGRVATVAEKSYWVDRVANSENPTYEVLVGAMYYHKARGSTGLPAVALAKAGAPTSTATNKDQLIKDVLLIFIKIYGNNPSEPEKAWWRKRISCSEIKNEAQLISLMNYHKGKGVRKGGNICGQTASSGPSGVSSRSVSGISNNAQGDVIRVGIYKTDGKAISVTANGHFQVREGGSEILGTLDEGNVVKVSYSGGKYHVRGSGLENDTDQEIRFVPLNSAIMQVGSYSDPSKTYPGKNYNRFRGIIEIRKCDNCNELWAINELRTELYLRGLGETSGTGPVEYLKALGVAARTYALYHKVITGGRFSEHKGFDITNTPNDQIYRGYEFEIIAPSMVQAFNAVRGVIVTNGEGDKPISTVYFSDSDGRTRSAQEVWGSRRFPYLQSVKDPHHVSSSCIGHCVGMSAQGAFGFAKTDGWDFKKILNYYYKGVRLIKAY